MAGGTARCTAAVARHKRLLGQHRRGYQRHVRQKDRALRTLLQAVMQTARRAEAHLGHKALLFKAGRLCKAQIHHPGSLDHLTEQRQTKCPRATGLTPGTRGALRHITSKPVPRTGYQLCSREHQHGTTTLLLPQGTSLPFFSPLFQPPLPPQMSGLLLEQASQGRGQRGLASSTAAVRSPLPTTAHSYNRTSPPKPTFQTPRHEKGLQAATEGPGHAQPQGDGP